MEIVKCTEKDIDEVSQFYDKVTKYLYEHINYPKWLPGDYPGRKSVCAGVAEGSQYACMDNGKVVGAFVINEDPCGNYEFDEWGRQLNEGEYLIIHTLCSDPNEYNRGIGKKMVRYCIDMARRDGYKAIRLDVVPQNIPAENLYESLGFTFVGQKDIQRGFKHIPLFDLFELNF